MSKVSQHTISVCIPQFLFGFRNVQSNVAIKTNNGKISFENYGYLPIQFSTISDLTNPFGFFKQFSGFNDFGLVQPSFTSNSLWLGLYSKHSIKYNQVN